MGGVFAPEVAGESSYAVSPAVGLRLDMIPVDVRLRSPRVVLEEDCLESSDEDLIDG